MHLGDDVERFFESGKARGRLDVMMEVLRWLDEKGEGDLYREFARWTINEILENATTQPEYLKNHVPERAGLLEDRALELLQEMREIDWEDERSSGEFMAKCHLLTEEQRELYEELYDHLDEEE